jgi:ribonucleoside-diphosphate reductase alpha chain
MYQDGRPGEIFIVMAKEGSTISGLMDSFATAISMALQHGVPVGLLVDKFKYTRFEPSGFSQNLEIGHASSIMDYIFRWLEIKFPDGRFIGRETKAAEPRPVEIVDASELLESESSCCTFVTESDAPACHECGAIMVRSGACHKCLNCGATSGCS